MENVTNNGSCGVMVGCGAKTAMLGVLEWMACDCGAEDWVKEDVLSIWARAEISYGENPPFVELIAGLMWGEWDEGDLWEAAYQIETEQPDLWRRAEEGYDSLPDDHKAARDLMAKRNK